MVDDLLDDDLYDDEDEDTMKDKYLTFRVGEEDYGLEIYHITEIVGMQRITEVPDMPAFVKGVINLRGQVIPVIDVRARFRLEAREYDERTCIIVVQIRESSVGLIVDTVAEVVNIPEDLVSPPPEVSRGQGSQYIKAMGRLEDSVKIILDLDRLLYEEDLARIGALQD